jgi:hypothetical protein
MNKNYRADEKRAVALIVKACHENPMSPLSHSSLHRCQKQELGCSARNGSLQCGDEVPWVVAVMAALTHENRITH